jgi:voltage-gated potassium channel
VDDRLSDDHGMIARWFKWPRTPRRAALHIAATTVVISVAGGILAWVLDRKDFPSLGVGLWWSLQTVTTVGYGDVVPHSTEGRVIGAVVMLTGVAFIAVITSAVAAALIESARTSRRSPEWGDSASPPDAGGSEGMDEYEIKVRGRVTPALLARFENMRSDVEPVETVLHGPLEDQAALHGVISLIQALGLELVEVRKLPARGRSEPASRRPE